MNMMTNLFSMFDPSNYYLKSAWMIMLAPLLMVLTKVKKTVSKKMKTISIMMNTIKKEVMTLNKKEEKKQMSSSMAKLFMMLVTMNLVAILPNNFTTTAHICICMIISLSMWMASMINAMANSFKSNMTHLTPMGTPMPLMNFMVIIEMVSNMIRPITLAVRLTANMVAGHLLMVLLSSFSMMSQMKTMVVMLPMILLVLLEMAVAMIQGYVITILICLYYKETF